MAPETLIFMPNGDVTLLLTRFVTKDVETPPTTSLVISEVSAPARNSLAPALTSIDKDGREEPVSAVEAEAPAEPEEPEESVLYFAPDPPESLDGPFYPPPLRAARGSNASSRRDRSASPPASFWASLKRQADTMAETLQDDQPVIPPKPAKRPKRIVVSSHEVYCVVSSRHMMLASQHFQTVLSGNFSEAITLQTKGHVTIPLSDDLETMIILLNIIHGASRKVPRQASLETLCKLAILVSKFEMLETVEFFSDTWIDHFQAKGLPKLYSDNVLPLLYVFWVFERPSEFKDMTRLAQRECNEKLDEDLKDLPISPSIIDAIKRDREFAMETAITVIHALIERYMVGQTICDGSLDDELRYACDAMVLGSLMKSSRKIGVWPKPEVPFNNRKFSDLASAIRSIRILDVCNKTSNRRWNSHGPSFNCHGLEDSIEASMKSIEAGLDGLELSDYKRKREDCEPGLQTFLLATSKDKLKEQDTRDDFQVYMKDEIVEAPEKEIKISQREYSTLQSTFSKPFESRAVEESSKQQEQTNGAPKDDSGESLKWEFRIPARSSPHKTEETSQEEFKVAPNRYLREFQQPPAQVSRGPSVQDVEETTKEELNADLGDSSGRATEMMATVITKIVEEPPREGVKPAPKEEVKVSADRKLNRTISFPKILKDEVKSPVKELQVAPRVASIEEMVEEVSNPAKEELKSSTIEAREGPNSAPQRTDGEEMWAPPKNFKMRKSKKTFSTRF